MSALSDSNATHLHIIFNDFVISNSGIFFLIDFTDLNHLDSLKMKNILNNEKGGGGGDSGIIEPIRGKI